MSSARAGAHHPRRFMRSCRECALESAPRRRRTLLDAAEPLLEALERFTRVPELGFGRGAALLELEEILSFVPVDLELQRRDALLPGLDFREQRFALPLELGHARPEEITLQEREDVALESHGEREL